MLLDGVAHPVDLRVAPDGLVVGVDHDALGQKKGLKDEMDQLLVIRNTSHNNYLLTFQIIFQLQKTQTYLVSDSCY